MKIPSLIPVYQPIVDITNSDIIAFEANIRGEDENGKIIRYEALRDANLIVDLDFKARDLALNQFKLRNLFLNFFKYLLLKNYCKIIIKYGIIK